MVCTNSSTHASRSMIYNYYCIYFRMKKLWRYHLLCGPHVTTPAYVYGEGVTRVEEGTGGNGKTTTERERKINKIILIGSSLHPQAHRNKIAQEKNKNEKPETGRRTHWLSLCYASPKGHRRYMDDRWPTSSSTPERLKAKLLYQTELSYYITIGCVFEQ